MTALTPIAFDRHGVIEIRDPALLRHVAGGFGVDMNVRTDTTITTIVSQENFNGACGNELNGACLATIDAVCGVNNECWGAQDTPNSNAGVKFAVPTPADATIDALLAPRA